MLIGTRCDIWLLLGWGQYVGDLVSSAGGSCLVNEILASSDSWTRVVILHSAHVAVNNFPKNTANEGSNVHQ